MPGSEDDAISRRWVELSLRVPAPMAEELGARIGPASRGFETVPEGDTALVKIFADREEDAALLRERAREILRRAGLDPDTTGLAVREVHDGRWVERFQEGLRPFPLGTRFLVVPGSADRETTERQTIRLVPSRAFGTGEHPTTRLCVEAMERTLMPGSDWLDLGTGSGILALVAAHLGAGTVYARDNDPEAVEVAGEVFSRNGMAGRIDLDLGSADHLPGRCVDGIVANIAAPYFLSRSGEVARLLRDGGRLLATGILEADRREVESALRRNGLAMVDRGESGDWILLEAQRRGGGA